MARGSILVVDDERGLVDVLKWELQSHGYDVVGVNDGSKALAAIEQAEFDVVISDVRMPGLSGIEVLKACKQLSSDTEVIITTGYAELDTVVDCVRGGAFDFIQKPFTLPAVVATVDRAVERRRFKASSKLHEVSLKIAGNRDPKNLPQLIAEGALELLEADAASLWLPAKEAVYLAHRTARGALRSTRSPHSPAELQSLAGSGPTLRSEGACIVYPLQFERFFGFLVLERGAAARRYRRSDLDRAASLAPQVMLALENSRLQAQAAANERLASIGQLAAGVAHEVNNPVSYVLMNLEAAVSLLEPVSQGDAEAKGELEVALRDARDGADRIREIVGDLKNMARADSGNRRRLDVNEVVRSALRVAGAELRRTQVERAFGERVEVEGDSGRLTQVLVNLLVNAAHAMSGLPHSENRVTVRTWLEGDKVRLSLKDCGPGVAPENQQRIFDAFFTTKPPGVGTGLGLSISRDIARAHGGDVELFSKPGEGACFVLTLPAAGPKPDMPRKLEGVAPPPPA